jgi:ABC-type bacteriocin/lantibiotic exporter with double-glycine peptidase domain
MIQGFFLHFRYNKNEKIYNQEKKSISPIVQSKVNISSMLLNKWFINHLYTFKLHLSTSSDATELSRRFGYISQIREAVLIYYHDM